MPFDANLMLLIGNTAMRHDRFVAPVSLTDGAWGAYVLDIRGTGAKGLAAVMIAPRIDVTYLNYFTGHIEVSKGVVAGWEQIASFPTLYQYVRKVPCVCTAVPVEADLGKYLYGGTTTDDGKIISFDSELYTVGGKGCVYVSMVDVSDTFDDAAEALTTNDAVGGGGGGTFTGTTNALSKAVDAGGIQVIRFATDKQYVRLNATIQGNFQAVMVGLVPWPFKTL